jgi:hypothetical protein
MAWWKKGLLWSVICVGLIVAVGFVFDDALPDDAVSSLCGSLGGVVLVIVWVVAFLKRSVPEPEASIVDFGPEEVVLSARSCNYLKHALCLACGTGYITDKRFVWEPLAGDLPSRIYGVKSVSIPLADLQEASRTTFGANKNVLSMQLASSKPYKFLVDDVEPWLKTLT